MSDSPKDSPAWVRDPCSWLGSRATTHEVPSPVSRYLAMPDGVRLAVDVYVPAGKRPAEGFPAILIFTPYYRRFALTEDAPPETEACPNAAAYRDIFVPHGYALVVVDVRGTGASFGTRDSFRSPVERGDCEQIMDWVAGQDWCNGRLGATGISYVGAAADFAASTGHPALKAIAPISAVWDTYHDHFYPGGLLLNQLAGAYDDLMQALDRDRRSDLARYPYFSDPHLAGPAPVDADEAGTLAAAAIAQHAGNVRMPDFIREFQFRGRALPYDPEFTSDSFSPHAYSDGMRPNLAVLSISGWMDGGYMNGAVARFRTLAGRPRHLLLGPWDHGARANVSPFRARFEPEFPVFGEILRFFDEYLMERDTGLREEAPVHYFTMAEEAWKAAPGWPAVAGTKTLHLAADGTLSPEPGTDGADGYEVDYGFGTGGNTRFARLQARAVEHYYRNWSARAGQLLRYRSAPLEADVTLAGHAIATIHMTTDQRDATVFVYIEDEAPDGTTRYVTEGVLRALHRKECDAPATYDAAWPYHSCTEADAAPVVPGEPVMLRFALLATSWRFRAGHRIGIAISGADKDNFSCLPHGRPGHWRILRGRSQASNIALPVE